MFRLYVNTITSRKRRIWAHEINLERKEDGEFHTLMAQMRLDEKAQGYFLIIAISFSVFVIAAANKIVQVANDNLDATLSRRSSDTDALICSCLFTSMYTHGL